MSADNEILKDFLTESKKLTNEGLEILEKAEGDVTQVKSLEIYGNVVDRIMGGAKSIALLVPKDHALHTVSDYAALCKAVGYKTAQVGDNEHFYNTCVALLIDATETLNLLLDNLDKTQDEIKKSVPEAFIERVRWVSEKFNRDLRGSVDSMGASGKKLEQNEIDALMKKLGF